MTDSHQNPPTEQQASRLEHPAAWRETKSWLERHSVQELRDLAERRGLPRNVARKTELVAELVELLANPARVREAIQALDANARSTLEVIFLLAANEPIHRSAIQKALLAWYGPLIAKDTTALLKHLTDLGLLFYSDNENTDQVQLPQAVSNNLHSFAKLTDAQEAIEETGLCTRETALDTVTDAVLHIWQYVKDNRVPIIAEAPQGLASRRAQVRDNTNRAVSEWLHQGDIETLPSDEHLYMDLEPTSVDLFPADVTKLAKLTQCSPDMVKFLYALMLNLGLVTRAGNRLAINELAMQRYRRQSTPQRLQILTSAWLATDEWSELLPAIEQHPQLRLRQHAHDTEHGIESIHADVARIRQFTARLLSLLDPETWYSLDTVLKTMWQLCPDLSCIRDPSHANRTWRLDSIAADSYNPYDFEIWRHTYGHFLSIIIQGPLFWLSSIKLGYRDGLCTVFRVNGLGSYLLGRYPQITASNGDMRPLTVGDDLSISIQLGRVDADVHDFLGQFTELVNAESDVFRYQITPEQFNQAMESGITLNEITGFLENVSGAPIPQATLDTLETWERNYGSIRLYEDLTVIEFADDFALKELLNTTSLADHMIYQLSPRLVVIEPSSVDLLMAEMVKRDLTPKIKEALE